MENLKTIRKSLNFTQKEIAQKLNIAEPTYSHYESGRYEPNIDTLIKLSDFFNCSVDYLIGHQTNNVVYLDTLTPTQKKLFELIKKLTDEQGLFLIGYISDMLKIPYDDVKPVRPW